MQQTPLPLTTGQRSRQPTVCVDFSSFVSSNLNPALFFLFFAYKPDNNCQVAAIIFISKTQIL